MKTNTLIIRPLKSESEQDVKGVELLDKLSGNNLMNWLEDNYDYAWGAFLENKLIGYCSIGYADELFSKLNQNNMEYNENALILKDLYVLEDYRCCGYGTLLLNKAIDFRTKADPENVFVNCPEATIELCDFLNQNGFELHQNGIFIKPYIQTKELNTEIEAETELELDA